MIFEVHLSFGVCESKSIPFMLIYNIGITIISNYSRCAYADKVEHFIREK